MLPGETNFKPEIGSVVAADSFTVTIDMDEVIGGTTETRTLEHGGTQGKITIGTNTDGRTDPPAPSDAEEVQLLVIDAVSGTFELSLTDEITVDEPSLNGGAKQTTGLITFDIFRANNLDLVKADLVAALTAWTDIDNVTVEAFDNVFMISFDTNPNFLNVSELVVEQNNLTKIGGNIVAPPPSTDAEVEQELTLFGNGGTFRLEYNGNTEDITYDPDNPNVDSSSVDRGCLEFGPYRWGDCSG